MRNQTSCPVTTDTNRYLAQIDAAESFSEAVQSVVAENEAETYSEENIVMALEAIQSDNARWDDFCNAIRNVDYNRLGVMLNNILVERAEDRAVFKLQRSAA